MEFMKYLCHRRPDRSFFFRGHQFPVCSRCTGLIIGSAFFMIYSYLNPLNYTFNTLIVSIILQLPYIIDGTTQYFNLRESNNILRLITGLLGGVGIVLLARTTSTFASIILHI